MYGNMSKLFSKIYKYSILFSAYHAYCEADLYMDRRESYLHGLYYFRVVGWLEENIVPGRLVCLFSAI